MKPLIEKLKLSTELILRIGGALCFFGHGALALGGEEKFLVLLSTFGLEQIQALKFLKLVGCIDILVGLFILFKPTKLVLQWAFLWTLLTIIAWAIHGDSVMHLFRRATYMTTPLALLFFLYKDKVLVGSTDSGDENVLTIERTAISPVLPKLKATQQLAIEKLDLSMICMKLMDINDGEGWSQLQCEEVSKEYKRYLTLKGLYPNESIVPNMAIDTMWHYHILDTAAYQRDCDEIFGYMLHHYPYFGMQGKADEKQFISAFDQTKLLYKKTFGSSMDDPSYLLSFQHRKIA